MGLLQTVLRLIDRAVGLLPGEWAERMRASVGGDLERERRSRARLQRAAQDDARDRGAAGVARQHAPTWRSCATRFAPKTSGSAASVPATSPRCWRRSISRRQPRCACAKRAQWQTRAGIPPLSPRDERVVQDLRRAVDALEQVKAMRGPHVTAIPPISKRLARSQDGGESAIRRRAGVRARVDPQRVGAGRQCVAPAHRRGIAEQRRRRAAGLVGGGRRADAVSARAGGSAMTAMEPPARK